MARTAGKGTLIETRRPYWRRPELAWLAAYPVAWAALFAASTHIWFLPAGLRLGVLWVLPTRLWPLMAVLEAGTSLALTHWRGVFADPASLLLAAVAPWCAYAASVRLADYRSGEPTPQALARLLLHGLAAAVLTAAALALAIGIDAGSAPARMRGLLFSFALGDVIGVVLVAPLLLALREQLLGHRLPARRLLADGAVLLPAGVAVLASVVPALSGLRYPIVLGLFPLFWLSFTYGWRACSIAIALMSAGVHGLGQAQLLPWPPEQAQLLMAATGSAALLLGISSDALRAQGRALASTIDLLSMRSGQLADAATRLATKQEEERRRIGAELHDQLGQDMTAIATRLRLAERLAINPALQAELKVIAGVVDDAHGHLRDIINHLHPLVLDRFGLSRALTAGPLAELARGNGIDYQCAIEGDVDALPPALATAIYRICQEATHNCVRHGCDGWMRIVLSLRDGPHGRPLLLRVEDGAGALEIPATTSGHGLQFIRDRANAIGADYYFHPESGTPRHWLQLSLPEPG